MLPDSLSGPAPEPKRKPKAAAPEPEAAPGRAPAAAVQAARSGVNDLYRLLSFQNEFDPGAVAESRAQLMQTLAEPASPERAVAEAAQRRSDAGLGLGGGVELSQSQRDAAERRAAAGYGTGGVDLGLGSTLSATGPTIATAKEQLAEALRDQREHAIGADQLDFTGKREKVVPLTREQYEALDPRQRQAIDFNTMLVRAVRRDRKNQGEYEHTTEEQRAKYDASVKDIFGEDRGSDMFAPETVAVLRQIGYSDKNADLDDFLSLRAAIHKRDIPDLAGPEPTLADALHKPEPSEETPARDRLNLSELLAAKTGQLQASLAKGTELLSSMNANATAERNDDVVSLGGQASKVQPFDSYYTQAFDILANTKSDPKTVLASIAQDRGDDFENVVSYFRSRLDNAERYGLDLGTTQGVKYRSPEEIRKLLGTDEGS